MTCKTCDRSRNCMLHIRAENPPEAAKQWMLRQCRTKWLGGHGPCDIHYTAGFALGTLPAKTQEKP